MDAEQGKLFIGGISWETTEDRLKEYFKRFGEVVEAVIMRDRATGRARGFGFVVFADPAVAERVVLDKHSIDGRTVEAKKAVPRDDQQNIHRTSSLSHATANQGRTKKIFVGGLASTVTESDFKTYFEQYGKITDVVVMYDHSTQRPRGFGFITFESENSVDKVLQKTFHDLNGKMVEVKKAVPKELSPSPARTPVGPYRGFAMGGNSSLGIGYGQGFNPSPPVGYGRYGIPSGARGAYSAFAASGYGAAFGPGINQGYGNNAYGGSLGYGTGPGGSYGGGSTAFAGPISYGNASANGGYASTPSRARNVWGNGGLGYSPSNNSMGYLGTASGNMNTYGSSSGAWGSSPSGQHAVSSPSYGSGSFGHGNNENGYGSSLSNYAGQNTGYGVGPAPYASVSSGYAGAYGDLYGDMTWKASTHELGGGSFYGFSNVSGEGSSNDSTTGNVPSRGITGRQTHRGSSTSCKSDEEPAEDVL